MEMLTHAILCAAIHLKLTPTEKKLNSHLYSIIIGFDGLIADVFHPSLHFRAFLHVNSVLLQDPSVMEIQYFGPDSGGQCKQVNGAAQCQKTLVQVGTCSPSEMWTDATQWQRQMIVSRVGSQTAKVQMQCIFY